MGVIREKSGLIVISAILTVGLIASAAVGAYGFYKGRNPNGVITATGSAKKQIKSDFAVWNCSHSVQAKSLTDAYQVISNNQTTVHDYLISKGIQESAMSISAINTNILYVRSSNGMETSEVDSYRLSQNIEIRSNEVEKISALSKQATELINKGINIQSQPPQYYYTKLADLKIDMLALATKDAKDRAEKIAANSNAQLNGLKSARAGVFQITALYSNEISDYGINDTSSIDKEIMAVMNCEFKIK